MINTVALSLPEKRIVFYNFNWQKYQKILEILGESRTARIIYDQGILEITMPLEEHEFAREIIGLFIRILVFEMGLKIKTLGSTTLNYPELDRGAEPDNCYYIQNQSKVAGKKIDLTEDPPPDLVVEVDITHTDINKLNLYASMGILEFWRYDGEVLLIYQLQNQKYVEVETSPTFPKIEKATFYDFIEQSKLDEVEAEKKLRADLGGRF
ncbi:MAG: Uma2 family endonuclease [Okeania sp. SIO3C4]|nr:Uma2 family endonuclease [Okeania sp. SIO3B3]NER07622.1 Uma2 family endonuclease [Okeania sp. SIO3C4]